MGNRSGSVWGLIGRIKKSALNTHPQGKDNLKLSPIYPKGRPYWKQRGWVPYENPHSTWYYGRFDTGGESVRGRVIVRDTLSSLARKHLSVYLKEAPRWFYKSKKRYCVKLVGEKGWKRIHFQKNHPKTVDQAILSVEAFLAQNSPNN